MLRRLIWGAAMLVMILAPSISIAAGAQESNYRGWKTLELKNEFVSAHLAPDVGGRIIQFKLGDHEFLWVNNDLAGKLPPATGLGPKGEWLNYGGSKLWPAPQGWSGPDEWPGPPGAVIEGMPHRAEIVAAQGTTATVAHTSPKDPYSGIQFSRKISVIDGAAGLRLESRMTNVDTKPRRWGIWEVTQLTCEGRTGEPYNKNMWAYTPMNPNSIYPKGFQILYGPKDNPAWQPDLKTGMFRAHYVRQVGKVGLDGMAGGRAVVDRRTGRAFVERFATFPEKKYPDNASVEFWLQAPGKIVVGGKESVIADNPQEAPPYMEAEVLSPFAELKPEESYTFRNEWFATNTGGDYPILYCANGGVTVEPLIVETSSFGGVRVGGRFGAFHKGKLAVAFFDANGTQLKLCTTDIAVSPIEPIVLDQSKWMPNSVLAPNGSKSVKIMTIDSRGNILGDLSGRSGMSLLDY